MGMGILALTMVIVTAAAETSEKVYSALFSHPRDVSEVLGSIASDHIRAASRIEVVRLRPETSHKPMNSKHAIGGIYIAVGPYQTLREGLAREMKAYLLSPRSYRVPYLAKLCGLFKPVAAIRFTDRATTKLDVLVSFSCDELRLHWGSSTESSRAEIDVHPAAPAMARILSVALPSDPLLKKIAQSRRPPPINPSEGDLWVPSATK